MNYSQGLELRIVSAVDASKAIGSYLESSGASNCEDCEAKYLEFTWELVEHTPLELQIQLTFEKSSIVSTSVFGMDSLELEVISQESLMGLQSQKYV